MIGAYFATIDEMTESMRSDSVLILGKKRERNKEIIATIIEANSNSLINQNGRINNS